MVVAHNHSGDRGARQDRNSGIRPDDKYPGAPKDRVRNERERNRVQTDDGI